MCYENKSLLVAYHHVKKRALCLISSPNGFLFILKLHINRIMCAEVGSGESGIITQPYSVVKYVLSFSVAFMEPSRSSAFIDFTKCRLSFWEVYAARILGSERLLDPSSELQLIISMWYMVSLNINTFPINFRWFLLNLAMKFVGKHFIEKFRDQVLSRMLVQN